MSLRHFWKAGRELWLPKEIAELKKIVNDAGLGIAGIESVNVSDDIKIGTAKEMSILIIILKRCRHWAKRIFIWYVIILCLYLTGRGQSLQSTAGRLDGIGI